MNQEALSLLSIFDTTKDQRRTFVAQVVDAVTEGYTDGLATHYNIKCLEEILKNITDDKRYKEAIIDSAAKYGEKPFEYKQGEIAIREAGVKYDYESCKDPKYVMLKQNFDKAKKDLEEYQDYLKSLPTAGVQVVDEDTGEVYKVHRPIKTSTTSVIIKLK